MDPTPRLVDDALVAAPPLVRLEGRDVLAVLHRIGTQSLADLAPGQVRMTLFCDFRGRLLHRAAVAVTSDGTVWLARDDAPADELSAFVDRSVFRDDARIVAPPEGLVVGRGGASRLATGRIEEQDGVPLRMQVASDFAYVLKPAAPPGPMSAERHQRVEFERIRSGRPRHGHEIHPDFHPFEVGLAHEVHLSKGCYTGQETLMRLVTYKSVRRRLVRLIGSGAPPRAPHDLRAGGARAGVVTSSVRDGEDWLGLGVLRHEAIDSGETLELENGQPIDVVEPFPETRPLGLPES